MVSTKVASTKIVCFTLSTNDSNSVPKKKRKKNDSNHFPNYIQNDIVALSDIHRVGSTHESTSFNTTEPTKYKLSWIGKSLSLEV